MSSMLQCGALCAAIPVNCSSSYPLPKQQNYHQQHHHRHHQPEDRNRRNEDEEKIQLTNIGNPTKNDVLCGRGVAMNNWVGNTQFRALVAVNKETYVTSTKRQKMAISRSIVASVRAMKNPPGRFLEKDPVTGLWNDVGDKKAIEKTSQALRDGAAGLRKELSKDLSEPELLSGVFDEEEERAAKSRSLLDESQNEREKDKSTKIKPTKAKPAVTKLHRRAISNSEVLRSVQLVKSPRASSSATSSSSSANDTKRTTSIVGNTAVIASNDSVEGVLMSPGREDLQYPPPRSSEPHPCSPEDHQTSSYYHPPPPRRNFEHHHNHPQCSISPSFHPSPGSRPTSPSSEPDFGDRGRPTFHRGNRSLSHRFPSREIRRSESYKGSYETAHRSSIITRSDSGVSEPLHQVEEGSSTYGRHPGEIIRAESCDGPHRSSHYHHPIPSAPYQHPHYEGREGYYSSYDERHHPLLSPNRVPSGPGPVPHAPTWSGPASTSSSSFPIHSSSHEYPKPPLSPIASPGDNFHSPGNPRWWGHSNPYRTASNGQLYIPSLHNNGAGEGSGPDYEYTRRIPEEPYMVSPHSTSHDFAPPPPPTTLSSSSDLPEVTPQRRHKIIVARDSEDVHMSSSSNKGYAVIKPTSSAMSMKGSKTSKRATPPKKKPIFDENQMYDSDEGGIEEKKVDSPDNINDEDLDDFSCSPLPYESEETNRRLMELTEDLLQDVALLPPIGERGSHDEI